MTDDQARATEDLFKRAAGPFQHALTAIKALETNHRTDISWISTETADRYNHIVLADGMDATAYQLNPIVTLNHAYDIPPIGKSLWQRSARRAGTKGIQAMTHYPERPKDLQGEWAPDLAFAQVCAGLLNAKSIGFIPLEIEEPANPDYPLIVRKWALIEYALGTIPVNPETTVIQINKTIPRQTNPLDELIQRIHQLDANEIVRNALDRAKGLA
jgi:hypothetical protein